MGIECFVEIGGDQQHHTFDAVPRIGEVIVLPKVRDAGTINYRVLDVFHHAHALTGIKERVRLIVAPE